MLNQHLSSLSSNESSIMITGAKNSDNKKKKEKQSSTYRSPFQDLNNDLSRNNSTSTSTISSSASIDAPKGCLRFFLSNPSSSKSPLLHRPKTKATPKSAPNANIRPSNQSSSSRSKKLSKENHFSKPKSNNKKKNPHFLYHCQNGNKEQPPITLKTFPRSKLLMNSENIGRNSASGSEEFGETLKESKRGMKKFDNAGEFFDHLNNYVAENYTPVSKLACGSVLDCSNTYDDSKSLAEQGSSSTVKTPPVQASVSPEIQCGSSVLESTNTKTPSTCYGAGHVISWVADNRKCRPKGILRVGVALDPSGCNMKGDVADSDYSCGQYIRMLRNSRASLIPLPVEASVSWHLSPYHDTGGEKDDSSRLGEKGNLIGSSTINLHSSPSSCEGVASYLCENDNDSGTANSDVTPSGQKIRITLLSPRRLPEFQGFSGHSSESDKVVGCQSSASPFTTSRCKAVLAQEEREDGYSLAGENSPFSIGSLSSGNVMQTPKSESSSERHVFPIWLDAEGSPEHHKDTAMESLAEVLRMQSLSPKSNISPWDPLGLSFQCTGLSSPSNSIDLKQLRKTSDNHDSWIAESLLDNVRQSQKRISWREGLVSRTFELDDLDCCKCFSDEENDAEGSIKDQLEVHHEFNVDAQDERISIDGLASPEFLDNEPRVGTKGKEKASPQRHDSCVESICTDGGGLVASGDSDWSLCYKNQLFEL